jgi:hypothetical protein
MTVCSFLACARPGNPMLTSTVHGIYMVQRVNEAFQRKEIAVERQFTSG